MADEFRGFSAAPSADLHSMLQFLEQCQGYLVDLAPRLGTRVTRQVFTSGRDTRGGRDYYFSQMEFLVRGRPDRSFIGFYHYAQHTLTPGSFFEVWDADIDDAPCFQRSVHELIELVSDAFQKGRLSDHLDEEAAHIRRALAL